MTKVSCNIIEDLLPLYCDNICSKESRLMVEEHLPNCEHCSQMLKDLQSGEIITKDDKELNEKESAVLGKMARSWKKSKLKSFAVGLTVATILLCMIFGAYYGLFIHQGSMVSPEQVIANGYMISDEQMTFRLQPTDGYYGGAIKTTVDENGSLYIAIYRTIIKEELQPGEDEIMNYGFNQAQKKYSAVYYGTPDNSILLWEAGMELPVAEQGIFD